VNSMAGPARCIPLPNIFCSTTSSINTHPLTVELVAGLLLLVVSSRQQED